jgi:signal transduction histidine kinase
VTDRSRVIALRSMVVFGMILSIVGSVGLAVTAGVPALFEGGGTISLMLAVFAVVVWLAAPAQPRNLLLWVLANAVLTVSVAPGGEWITASLAPELQRPLSVSLVPAELPAAVAWTTGWSYMISTFGYFGLLTFGILLFPDGKLPSRRWRPVGVLMLIGLVALSAQQLVDWLPSRTVSPAATTALGSVVVLLGPPVSLAGLIVKYRRADGSSRDRIKWIMWGAAILVPFSIAGLVTELTVFTFLGGLALVSAYGIAILRHRLLDIDIVISRTVVYASLAAFIGVVYVAVVVGIGSWIGSGDEPNAALAIGATAIVAVGFQPVRRRMKRVANRIVFGRRATPYEVLSDFSRRLAATSNLSLEDAARSLVEGTGAERVVISVATQDGMAPAASWPDDTVLEHPQVTAFPIEHEGTGLGRLELQLQAGQQLQEDDARLARQMASGLGLALRNQRLTRRLERRVDELRVSRRRLVAVQDETRRRLERDLHDGAQQQLVALKVKLGLARTVAGKDGADDTVRILDTLSARADSTVEAMREFARGIYPPLLEAEGLATAISAHARRAPIPVSFGRYEREVESAVYFCVTEALQNVTRHAGATRAGVSLAQRNGELAFEIRDDGTGFDPTASHDGTGLAYMTDRTEALSGTITITSTPDAGTVVVGRIPATAEVPA